MIRSFLVVLAFAMSCRTAVAQDQPAEQAAAVKSYPIKVQADEVRELATLKFEADGLRLETGPVTVIPISCELGITGAVLLGNGKYRYAPEADKVFEGTFRAGMLRFNPQDQATWLPLDATEKVKDASASEMAKHLLSVAFRHCWHSGMEALIPPERTVAAVLYTKEHGDLLISFGKESATVYSFTSREKLYDKK